MASTDKVKLVAEFEDRMSGPMKNAGDNSVKFGKLLAGIGAGAVAVGVLILALARKMGTLAAKMRDTAADLRTTTDDVQAFNYAFEQTGGSVDTFQSAMRGVTTFMRMAETGAAEQTRVLESLGTTYEQLAAMAPEDQFMLLTDRIGAMTHTQNQATAAATLFGARYSQQIIGTLEQVGGTLRDVTQEFRDSDMMIPAEDIVSLGAFADKWTDVEKKMDSLMVKVVIPFLPAIEAVFDGLENLTNFALPHLIQIINDSMPALIGFIDALAFVAKTMNDIKPDLVTEDMEEFEDILKDLGETAKTDVTEGLETASEAMRDIIERTNSFIEAEKLNEVQAAYLQRGMAALGAELYFTGLQQAKLAEETEASANMLIHMDEVLAGMNITGYTELVKNLTLAELELAESMYQVVLSSGFLSDTFSEAATLALEEIQAKIEEMAAAVPPPGSLTPEYLEKELRARDQVKEAILEGIAEAAQAEADAAADQLEQEQTSASARRIARLREKAERLEIESDIEAERTRIENRITTIAYSGAHEMGRILINKGKNWETQMMTAIGKMILKMAAIKIGGPIGGIFGFIGGLFQQGTLSIPHAQDGWQTPTGLYGDRFPVMVEGGEEVISREQRIMNNNYSTSSSSVNVSVFYQPTLSTASPGEMVVLGNMMVEALEQAGVSIG